MRRVILMLSLLLAAPATAQTKAIPSFGIDRIGSCRALSVRDVSAAGNVDMGCIVSGIGYLPLPTTLRPDFALPVTPVANPLATKGMLALQGTTQLASGREYVATFGLENDKGGAASGYLRDKAVLYTGINCKSGGGDCWSINPVITSFPGFTGDAQGIELDCNNNTAHRGDADGGAGLASPTFYCLTLTGASSYRLTAMLGITGGGVSGGMANRGIVFSQIKQATLQDLSLSDISYDLRGTHIYGIDTANAAFTGNAIRLGNGQRIVYRNATGTADLTGLLLNNGNNLQLGGAGVGSLVIAPPAVVPSADNVTSLGQVGSRFANVRAVKVFTGALNITSSTPSSASATCTMGDITADTAFVYFCTATNTWKRAALTGW